MGVDVLGWVQAANPPDFDLPRKENPRRKLSEAYSVSFYAETFSAFSLLVKLDFYLIYFDLGPLKSLI